MPEKEVELQEIEKIIKAIKDLEAQLGVTGKISVDPIVKTIKMMSETATVKKDIAEIEKKKEELSYQLKELRGRLETIVDMVGIDFIEQLAGKEFADNVRSVLGAKATTMVTKTGKIPGISDMGIIYCGQLFKNITYFLQRYCIDKNYRAPAKFIEYLTSKRIPYEIVEKEGKRYLVLNTAIDILDYRVR
ncbi:MAG: hypothetical protein QXS19_07630 [Candidatus Methanomethylicia archaeon]